MNSVTAIEDIYVIRELEQLRVLEHGYRIRMVYFEHAPIAVDTETDLARVRAILENSPNPSAENRTSP